MNTKFKFYTDKWNKQDKSELVNMAISRGCSVTQVDCGTIDKLFGRKSFIEVEGPNDKVISLKNFYKV